jgi:hypothetical protein
VLKYDFNKFRNDFKFARNAFNDEMFKYRWQKLLNKWHERLSNNTRGIDYVNKYLYKSRRYWSWASYGSCFTAGKESTQRDEGYNRIVKHVVNSNMGLEEIVTTLQKLSKDKQLRCDYKTWMESKTYAKKQ